MGFKNITLTELKIKQGPSFIGVPSKIVGQIIKEEETKIMEVSTGVATSEVIIENEELLEYNLHHNGTIKSIVGYGNILITNNSGKDRIWDTQIIFSGSEFNSLDSENEMNLGIFEPKTSRNIKYNIVNGDQIKIVLTLQEMIEILSDEGRVIMDDKNSKGLNYFLMYGKENIVQFHLTAKNTSRLTLKNINVRKQLSKSFYEIKFEDKTTDRSIKISRNIVDWFINHMAPGETKKLVMRCKVHPKTIDNIRTGKIDLSYAISDHMISGTKINNFLAYSHAHHLIEKVEMNEAPNKWGCSLRFTNKSTFPIKLKSIIVTNKEKTIDYLNLDLATSSEELIIQPKNDYNSKIWQIESEEEPRFSRKIEYSVVYQKDSNTEVVARIDDEIFNIVGLRITKEIPEKEIKSFEKSTVNVDIKMENMGTTPVKGVLIREKIPEDFLPPQKISDYKFTNQAGAINSEEFNLKIIPDNNDPSKSHIIEITNKSNSKNAIGTNDFIGLKYSFKAISPDNKKDYKFPLEVKSFYYKYKDQEELKDYKYEEQAALKVFYVKEDKFTREIETPTLNIAHKRRKASIGKEIYPGRTHDEFAIVITIRNKSNVELKDLDIMDTF
ncbi:MAG: hypothetical protein ACFE8P_02670, partial [Promethearchaeota archaeon]